jgi:hypothetical protein
MPPMRAISDAGWVMQDGGRGRRAVEPLVRSAPLSCSAAGLRGAVPSEASGGPLLRDRGLDRPAGHSEADDDVGVQRPNRCLISVRRPLSRPAARRRKQASTRSYICRDCPLVTGGCRRFVPPVCPDGLPLQRFLEPPRLAATASRTRGTATRLSRRPGPRSSMARADRGRGSAARGSHLRPAAVDPRWFRRVPIRVCSGRNRPPSVRRSRG